MDFFSLSPLSSTRRALLLVVPAPPRYHIELYRILVRMNYDYHNPFAFIYGYVPKEDKSLLAEVLQAAGFTSVETNSSLFAHRYTFSKATGMWRLMDEPIQEEYRVESPPKWIPIVREEENVLLANGWSFVDPDENEPLSAFDVDVANLEG